MSIKERAKKQQNWIEKGLTRIPGFKGYYERELRRDSDKLQREFIVLKLNDTLSDLTDIVREVTRKGDLKLLTEYGELQKYFEKVINNIRYSDRGYSGFFDLIKIREEELDVIYEMDLEILESVLKLRDDFPMFRDMTVHADQIRNIRGAVKDIEESYNRRNTTLKGFGPEKGGSR